MADEKETWGLDLDHGDFVAKALEAKGAIAELGEAKNLEGLVQGLKEAGLLIGTLGVVAFSLKETFDIVFDAEKIQAVNAEFETLARQSGLVGNELKEGLEKASGGLIPMNDLLKIANRSMVTMGASAQRLPEILELARKAAVLTGTDAATAFDQLSHAVAIGSQRQLKQLGIVVDTEKAYQKFAASIGLTVDQLSEEGKRQAVLNEALEKGKAQLAGVNPEITKNINLWAKFKTTIAEAGESFTLWFGDKFGSTVSKVLSGINDIATNFKTKILSSSAEGQQSVEATERRLEYLEQKIAQTRAAWKGKEKDMPSDIQQSLESAIKDVGILQERLEKLKGSASKAHEERAPSGEGSSPAGNQNFANRQKILEDEAKFQKEMQKLDNETAKVRAENNTSDVQAKRAADTQKEQLDRDYNTKVKELETNKSLTDNQKAAMRVSLTKLHAEQKKQIELNAIETVEKAETKAYENRTKAAKSFFDKFAAGATLASHKAKVEWANWSAFAEQATNNLGSHLTQAFEAVGQGTKSLGEAMKEAIIGELGDEAVARGELLIASSIWPPNPLGLSAGAGLVTLGGALHALAGGGGGATAGLSAPSAAAGGITPVTPVDTSYSADDVMKPDASLASATPQKTVSIIIQGNYLETDQTKQYLVDLVRSASDATDFRIAKVGGGV
jgi:hypothetical protein